MAWEGQGFLNHEAYLPSTKSKKVSQGILTPGYEMVSLTMLYQAMPTDLVELKTSNLITPDPEIEELLQKMADRAALQVMGLRLNWIDGGQRSVSCCRKCRRNHLSHHVFFCPLRNPSFN